MNRTIKTIEMHIDLFEKWKRESPVGKSDYAQGCHDGKQGVYNLALQSLNHIKDAAISSQLSRPNDSPALDTTTPVENDQHME